MWGSALFSAPRRCGCGWSIEYQRLCRSHAVFNVPILCSSSQEPVSKAHSEWSSWLHPPSNGSYTSTDPRNQLSLSDDLRISYPVSRALESFCWKLGASHQFWEPDTEPEWGFRMAVHLVHVCRDTEGSEWRKERRGGRRRAAERACLKRGKCKSCTDIRTAQIIQNKMQSAYLGNWRKINGIYLKQNLTSSDTNTRETITTDNMVNIVHHPQSFLLPLGDPRSFAPPYWPPFPGSQPICFLQLKIRLHFLEFDISETIEGGSFIQSNYWDPSMLLYV